MENPYKAQSKVNPQRANRAKAPGHHDRRVNNDVWHALMLACMSGGEYQVVLTVIDRTWGFSKLSAPIPLKKFEDSTNLTRQGIIKALKRVEGRHIIVCHRNGTKTTEYLFNKHYDTWTMPSSKRELTSEEEESSDDKGSHLVNGGSPAPSEPLFTSEKTPLVNQRSPAPSEPLFTSEKTPLVNQRSPDKSTTVYQNSEPQLTSASKQAKRGTEPVKTLIIDTPIDTIKDTYTVVFNHWNSLTIITHKKMTDGMKQSIDGAIKDYSQEEIEQAMRNYAVIVKGADYYFDHKWTLAEFLSRGKGNNIERFLDLEVAKSNFKKEAGHAAHKQDTPKRGGFAGFKAIESGPEEPDGGDED